MFIVKYSYFIFIFNFHNRELAPKLGLRKGWKEAMQALTLRSVPTYLFSSGYGDVVAQTLVQEMYQTDSHNPSTSPQTSAYLLQLPQNVRIISNFFRAAPDGTVRAFSQPMVHERFVTIGDAKRNITCKLV